MGLLDDAIREHLELKRRHGASDDEVSAKAAEAFGPVRREVAAAPPEPVAAPPEPVAAPDDDAGEPRPQLEADVEDAHTDAAQHVAARAHETTELEPPAVEPPAPPPRPAPSFGGDPFADDEPFADPLPPRRPAAGAAEPADAAPEPSADDVLEETPEFLQDAPEHDRLWFEQKPPRDFDFDG
jgi:hypothetical protein